MEHRREGSQAARLWRSDAIGARDRSADLLSCKPVIKGHTVNAIKLLEQQHREVEQLFKQFEALEDDDSDGRSRIFIQLADALAAHATIEEKIFYPSVFATQTEEVLREAVEEHLGVKRVIADLLDMEADDEQFDAKVSTLRDLVEHHVGEEETVAFPKVLKLFEAESLEVLGVEMENLLAELMAEGDPRNEIPNELSEAAPLQ